VETVPVFILTRQGARFEGCGDEACFSRDDYVRLAGDVSIAYALDAIERLAPQFRDDVAKARAGQ
jgi:conjugal transfer pilus assembly protein TrbC